MKSKLPENQRGSAHKNLITAFAVVVVLGLVLAVIFGLFRKQPPSEEPGPQAVHAPAGELTPGFPEELVVADEEAQVTNSYYIDYAEGGVLRTGVFVSSQTMIALFNEYREFFQENGWTITNEITDQTNSRGLYAKRDGSEASVAISDRGEEREIIVGYLEK